MKDTTPRKGLELLRENHAGLLVLRGETLNYGVIRRTEEHVVIYTGKGLREMWKPEMTREEIEVAEKLKQIAEQPDGEQQLISSGHIRIIALNDIERVIF